MSFFDRKEVRDVMAYLRVIANPDDETSLLRILNCPPRGIGKSSIEKALNFASAHDVSLSAAFLSEELAATLPTDAARAGRDLLERLALFGKKRSGKDLASFVERVVSDVSYRAEVDRAYSDPKERENRWSAVEEILNHAENYSRRATKPSLAGFLNELSLTAEDAAEPTDAGKRDAVTLVTLHSAKGLEFPRVYLVGFEEGLLPHARSVQEDTIEEERRLAYVGITRAREALSITFATERAKYGRRGTSHPSRFLYEIKGEDPPKEWVAAGEAEMPKHKKKKRRRRKVRR
jgi:DNA helicase-2/ATP-dependent DNA helicase PcrA